MNGSLARWLGSVALIVLVALLVSGCGSGSDPSDSESGLASLVPSDSVLYLEGVLRPEGTDKEAIEAIASRFPQGSELDQEIIDGIDRSLAESSDPADPPSFAADIEPWLGERGAAFWPTLAGDPATGEDPPSTGIVETTDAEEAGSAIERLAASNVPPMSEEDVDGTQVFVDEDGQAVAVVRGYVVFGPEEAVDAVIGVEGGDEPLSARDGFTFDVGDVDGSSALGFAWLDTGSAIEQSLDPSTAASLEPGQLDDLISQAGFDGSAPATFALTATADSASLDSSVGISDEYESGSSELVGELPSSAFLAADCTGCLRGFRVGFDYGIAQSAAEDGATPEQAEEQIRTAFGVTSAELDDALGSAAVYLDSGSFPVGGAAVIEITDPDPISRAIDVIPTALGLSPPPGTSVDPLSPSLPGDGLEGFTLTTPDLPQPLTVASDGERLVIALGDDAAAQALAPAETIADAGSFERVGGDLEGFEPSAVLDLQAALPTLESLLAGNLDFATAAPYLKPIVGAVAGDRVEGDRLLSRLAVSVG